MANMFKSFQTDARNEGCTELHQNFPVFNTLTNF